MTINVRLGKRKGKVVMLFYLVECAVGLFEPPVEKKCCLAKCLPLQAVLV